MTDSPDMDLLVKAADNPDQIAPPAANEVRAVRPVTLLYGRGETVYTSNVYELMEAAKEAEAKSYLQQLQERISNVRLQIKTMTAFGQKNATTIGQARRLNVDLIVMSSLGRSGISR
jgi:nucleotide-binding universal stress UspA family protein